jgi:hypothetical protein
MHFNSILPTRINYLLFYVPLKKKFYLKGDVTIASEGLQNLGLRAALSAFEQRVFFIVPHLLRFLQSHPKDHPTQSLLRHTRRCGGTVLTRIITGYLLGVNICKIIALDENMQYIKAILAH